MKQLNLCIDIDGTVTEAYYWISRANGYFNTKITPKDVQSYEIHEVLEIPREDYNKFYTLYGEILHEEANIRQDAKEILCNWYGQHKIHFVTARDERMRNVTNKWFKYHNILMDSLSLLGSHDKVAKAEELACDIFIEDRYENALQLAIYGFDVLLIDCTYNKGPLPPKITRVTNWLQIKNIVDDRAQEQYAQFRIAK